MLSTWCDSLKADSYDELMLLTVGRQIVLGQSRSQAEAAVRLYVSVLIYRLNLGCIESLV